MPRVAWISPICRPGELRSAAYSRAMLKHLVGRWEIELFVDDCDLNSFSEPFFQTSGDTKVAIYHYHRIFERNRCDPFDVFIHQLEDSSASCFVERCAAVWPGLCMFHDMNLNRLHASRFSHSTAASDINALMNGEFGTDCVNIGDYFVRDWPIEVYDRVFPLGHRELMRRQAVLAFFRSSAEYAAGLRDGENVFSVHPCVEIPPRADLESSRQKMRKKLACSGEDLVLFYLGREKLLDRADVVLDAIGGFCRKIKALGVGRLVFIWPFLRSEALRRSFSCALEKYPELGESFHDVSYKGYEGLCDLLSAADVVLGLRFDSLRGLSHGLLEAMARGVPAFVSDTGAGADMPPGTVAKIPLGREESGVLVRVLERLDTDKSFYKALSEGARGYVETCCVPEIAAAELMRLVSTKEGLLKTFQSERASELYAAQQEHINRFRDMLHRRDVLSCKHGAMSFPGGLESMLVDKVERDFSWNNSLFLKGDR